LGGQGDADPSSKLSETGCQDASERGVKREKGGGRDEGQLKPGIMQVKWAKNEEKKR
jgi:hypothetical protein